MRHKSILAYKFFYSNLVGNDGCVYEYGKTYIVSEAYKELAFCYKLYDILDVDENMNDFIFARVRVEGNICRHRGTWTDKLTILEKLNGEVSEEAEVFHPYKVKVSERLTFRFENGKLHSLRGWACLLVGEDGSGSERRWYLHGKLHREGRPALKIYNRHEWWINGIKFDGSYSKFYSDGD